MEMKITTNVKNVALVIQILAWIQVVSSVTETFSYTGSYQKFVVPATVTSIKMEVTGGQGGGNFFGAIITADVPVTAGETLYVYVGGAGSCVDQSGGFNGGGAASLDMFNTIGCGGGGASDVRTDAGDLNTRLIAAGGSGGDVFSGEYGNSDAGDGGCPSGFSGEGSKGASGSYGGGGANQTHGGRGGYYSSSYQYGGAGTLGFGGNSGSDSSGGGGGGGWYGGGGGASTGGGGGSSYSPYAYSCGVYASDDVYAQDGKVVFTYAMDYTFTYDYTGSSVAFNPPSDVDFITVNVSGAAGGSSTMGSGGLGGQVTANFNTTSGSTYYVTVGSSAGYNGGGANGCDSAGNGGGASSISTSAINSNGVIDTDSIIVMAGGGGGAGYDATCTSCTVNGASQISGGYGGGSTAEDGDKDPMSVNSAGGGGGSQSSGGLGGTYEAEPSGSNGAPSSGGDAGSGTCGGGGGAGYYGGGGGANTGGGGGSNFVATEATSVVSSSSKRVGNGAVSITFKSAVYEPPSDSDDNDDNGHSGALSMAAVLGIFFALLFTACLCGAVIQKRSEPPARPPPSQSSNPMH